jgi:hypothetical protein
MNKRLDEIKNNIFTNWDIAVNKGGETIAELKQLYEQTGDPECLWLISELLIHKARGGRDNDRRPRRIMRSFNRYGL